MLYPKYTAKCSTRIVLIGGTVANKETKTTTTTTTTTTLTTTTSTHTYHRLLLVSFGHELKDLLVRLSHGLVVPFEPRHRQSFPVRLVRQQR